MDGWVVVRDWDKFQHYKDRDPIWIRTYTRLLHDDAYRNLTGHQRAVLHGLWLAYASSGRQLRLDTRSLSARLNLRVSSHTLESLNNAGFIDLVASTTLAQNRTATEKQKRVLRAGLPTAVASYDTESALSNHKSKPRQLPADLLSQLVTLKGADDRTPQVLASFARRGLPEAAFRNALEATHEAANNKRLRGTEISYLIGTLRQLERAGQYA
jgi:hypothetical protein